MNADQYENLPQPQRDRIQAGVEVLTAAAPGAVPAVYDVVSDILDAADTAAPPVLRSTLAAAEAQQQRFRAAEDWVGLWHEVMGYLAAAVEDGRPLTADALAYMRERKMALVVRPSMAVLAGDPPANGPGKHAKPIPCDNHEPRQHRDGRRPWCRNCGLDAAGEVPPSRFPNQQPPQARPETPYVHAYPNSIITDGPPDPPPPRAFVDEPPPTAEVYDGQKWVPATPDAMTAALTDGIRPGYRLDGDQWVPAEEKP